MDFGHWIIFGIVLICLLPMLVPESKSVQPVPYVPKPKKGPEKYRYFNGNTGEFITCSACENDTFVNTFQLGMMSDMKCCRCGKVMRTRDGGCGARKVEST